MTGRRAIILCLALVLLAGFVSRILYYSGTEQRMAQAPGVVNLTEQGLKSQVAFGLSPRCGEEDCWTQPGAPTGEWHEALLPKTDLSSLPGYAKGLADGWVYYRMELDVPPALTATSDIVSFTPMWVNHRYFEVYLNGRSVYVGGMDSPIKVVNIPLPKKDLLKKHVLVAIKGSLSRAEVGIRHLGALYLGPAAALNSVYVAQEHVGSTFWLLFVLSKGGIFLVFSLVYLFSRHRPELFAFLCFAMASVAQDVLESSLLAPVLPFNWRVLCFFLTRGASFALLLWFVYTFCERRLPTNRLLAATGALLLLVGALCHDLGWGTQRTSVAQLFALTHHVQEAFLLAGLWVCGLAVSGERPRRRQAVLLLGFLAVHFLLVEFEFYELIYKGPNLRPLIGLTFFLFIAYLVAEESGRNAVLVEEQAAELAESRIDRAVARAAQMLAHDARKPLSLVHMMFKRLRSARSLGETGELLDRFDPELSRSLATVNALIEDVMTVGFGGSLDVQEQRLETLAIEALTTALETTSADLALQTTWRHSRTVLVDERKLRRVLSNIVENALQALPRGPGGQARGRLWLETRDEQDGAKRMVALGIGNSGSPISKEDRERLFEPFFTKGKKNGTGLGLAIARRLVQAHGGRIWCDSSPTQGTVFWLTLPASGAEPYTPEATVPGHHGQPALAVPKVTAAPAYDGPTVALVDDSIFVRECWRTDAVGMQILTYADGDELLAALAAEPDLLGRLACVITDYYFSRDPDDNGVVLARRLKSLGAVPVFLASDSEFDEGSVGEAIDGRLGKTPCSWAEIAAKIAAARPPVAL